MFERLQSRRYIRPLPARPPTTTRGQNFCSSNRAQWEARSGNKLAKLKKKNNSSSSNACSAVASWVGAAGHGVAQAWRSLLTKTNRMTSGSSNESKPDYHRLILEPEELYDQQRSRKSFNRWTSSSSSLFIQKKKRLLRNLLTKSGIRDPDLSGHLTRGGREEVAEKSAAVPNLHRRLV